MTVAISINPYAVYYLPAWVVHPTIISTDDFLFNRKPAEQAGGAKGWRPAKAGREGILQQHDGIARSAINVCCLRCEAPKPSITYYNDIISNNDLNNDLLPPDNLNDGTEDTNHNGRIDGDNGDGIYQTTEYWTETNPNNQDTDSDEIHDQKEIEFGYSPIKADTDGDTLIDSEEDSDKDGNLDAGETNPLETDTDKDGLDDNMEIAGWTVVIIYEATKEMKTKYTVTSNPRDADSEDDGLSDLQEYSNVTDPWESDSDGDGKTDLQELTGDYNSSATGIDGAPPEIWYFDVGYEGSNYEGLGPLKIPTKLEVYVTVGAKDIFGIEQIFIDITGLENKLINTDNRTNVSYKADWTISGLDKIKRVAWDGFKINVSVTDRNNNVGFKEDEIPSIKDMVIDFLGPLINIVEMIGELVSGFMSWIEMSIKELFKPVIDFLINTADGLLIYIFNILNNIFSNMNSTALRKEAESFAESITSGPIIIALAFVGIAISAILLICCGIDSLISIAIQLVIVMFLAIFAAVSGGECDFSSFSSFFNPIDDGIEKLEKNEKIKGLTQEEFNFLLSDILSIISAFTSIVLSIIGICKIGSTSEKLSFNQKGALISSCVSIVLAKFALFLTTATWFMPRLKPYMSDSTELWIKWGFLGIGAVIALFGWLLSLSVLRNPGGLQIFALALGTLSTLIACTNFFVCIDNNT